jgi:type IV secretion system protein TrbJ
MRMKMLALVVCLALAIATPGFAILGIGDIVFDPTIYANAVQQYLQMVQQYEQLVQTYEQVRNQYEHMRRMAQQVPVDMNRRYRALFSPPRISSSPDAYGTSGGWINGINSGSAIERGYAAATLPLRPYGAAFSLIPSDQADRVKASYATVELTDSANVYGLQTIGDLRGHADDLDRAIANLENDSLSGDPNMNTEIAVLNKINAANMLTVRNTQNANRLLVALAEEKIVEAKRQRDAEAAAIEQHARFLSEGRQALTEQGAGASQAMLSWRMP